MQAIWVESSNEPLVLRETSIPALKADEVLVKVEATAVNRADILQAKGHYPPPPGSSQILGLEFAGIIQDVGQAKTSFKLGDRVMGIVSGGSYANFVAVPAAQLLPIPEHLSFIEAAAIPEAFITANEALFEIGGLKKGERLLLHASTSGVGSAALQLAQHTGVKVIALARDDAKLLKIAVFHPELCINYQTCDWVKQLENHQFTGHIDVIADFIGAEYMTAHLNLLAIDGRMIHLATMRGNLAEVDLRLIMRKQLRLQGFQLRLKTPVQKALATQHLWQRFGKAFEDGEIKQVIAEVLPLADASKAHTLVEQNQHVGKVVLLV